MATAEGSYEGGVGGKLPRRPIRRAGTPYDRPLSAIRNPIEAGRNGWLSKFVDPASRIITRSAQRFFSSVFRKNLPAPPTVSEANLESRNEFLEVVSLVNPSSGAQELVCNGGDKPNNRSDSNGINELEQILKQKTFTRSEIDHLTELLRSRTVNASAEDGNKRSEPSTSHQAAALNGQELANIPLQENGIKRESIFGVSVPVVNSSVIEEDVASPADVAKTYMGSRSSKVTPSTIGLCSQAFREDASLLTNVPFPLKSPHMSLAPRSTVRFGGVPGVSESGSLIPGPRGRSAIYSMARSPYSRVNNTPTLQGVGSSTGRKASPLTPSQWPWENATLSGGKQVAKRRSSVLDSDIGSVGPIRRIRQKTNFMSPSKNINLLTLGSSPIPATVAASAAAQGSMSLIKKPLRLDGLKHNTSARTLAESEDNNIPSADFSSVPSQSSVMAQKILQQLDKLVPSPKEKSSDLKLATAREKSPTKLTLSMLHGRALRSLENVDSSKFLRTLDDHGVSSMPVARASTSQEQVRVDENGPMKITVSGDKSPLEENGVVTTLSTKDSIPSVKTTDSVVSNFVANPPQEKRAFQISVPEDYLEFDDDSFSNRIVSTPLAAEKEKLDASIVESKAITTEMVTVETPPISSSEIRPTASLVGKKTGDTGASEGSVVAEKDMGFTFPVSPSSSTTTQPSVATRQSPSLFNVPTPPKEPTAASVFGFSSKSVDNATPFAFSSSSSRVGESSGLKFGAQSDSKFQTLSSAATVPVTMTETTPSTKESDKGIDDKTQKAGDCFIQPENAFSSAVSATIAPNIFSFGATTSNSSLNNGSVSLTPSLFSVPIVTPSSTRSTNNIFSSIATPITAADTVTTSSPSISASTSIFSAAPIFQFGSNISAEAAAPSSSASLPAATSVVDSKNAEPKTKQPSPFGSLSSSPFGATSSSASTGTGSTTFAFGASAPSSTTNPSSSTNNLFQSSNTSAAAGSIFSASIAPGTGVTPFTQSMPMQFGSPSSSTFGSSGSSSSSSGSFLFGSSMPGTNPFGSSSGFGLSSSTTLSTGASSFSSSNGSTGLFGSSTQSATSSIFGSGFGSTSSTPVFSFGVSSAAAATTSSAPIAFRSSAGASSGSSLPFTSATAAAAISSASLSPSFPVFGSPNPVATFGSASPGNEQMNMEDSMAEDTVQASIHLEPVFGQPANTPQPSNFIFGTPAPAGTSLFQFGSQQNTMAPQNPSPFQATSNLGFSGGGSFSLGSGGGDKSKRKIVKVRRDKLRNR